MPRGKYTRCRINEWVMLWGCRKGATALSYINEATFDNDGYMARRYYAVCEKHYQWLNRSEDQLDIDYPEWELLHANV